MTDDLILGPLEPAKSWTPVAKRAHDRICELSATPAEVAEIAELARQRAEADQ